MKTRAAHARPPAARHNGRPAGFTLVEILMVILIIGMLVTLISAAAVFAIRAAERATIKVEISNLDVAMQNLSTQSLGGEYPPCMGVPAGVQLRSDQFSHAIRKRFPRCSESYATATAKLSGWQVRSGDLQSTTPTFTNLNLDALDSAEALVFWLAGPPTPCTAPGVPASSTIMWGFCNNATTPLAAQGSRIASIYEFDESRLTDQDGDGWPEYIPKGVTSKIQVAPFVYFDNGSYLFSFTVGGPQFVPSYPGTGVPFIASGSTLSPGPTVTGADTAMTNMWGFAVPYADTPTSPATGLPTAWNPKKFQIISAGLDSEYGGGPSEDPSSGRPNVATNASSGFGYNIPLVPKNGITAVPTLLHGDWDNQVNFLDGVLEDQTGQ